MAQKAGSSGRGGWVFLAVVVAAYGVTAVLAPQRAAEALVQFGVVIRQVVPALGLVWLLLFVTDLLLDARRVRRHLGRESGLRGWFVAALAGVVAAGPIYAWYATLAELRGKGMRDGLIATFLFSRAIKLPLLPVMIHYFGVAYTVLLSLYLLLFAFLCGTALEWLQRGQR